MTRFNVNGKYLDLYADTRLQFVRKNILFAFGDIQLNRTAEFQIPATPTNNLIFAIANDAARYSVEARTRIAAQMQYSSGCENGYLYLSKCNKREYSVVFVYGELLKLKALKEAGKIAEYMTFADSAKISSAGMYEADAPSIPLFANVAYRNGHTQPPNPSDNVNYDPNYFPLPSIGLQELIEQCLYFFGMTIDATEAPTLAGVRLTIAQPKTRSGEYNNPLIVVRGNIRECNRIFFRIIDVSVSYNRGDGEKIWYFQALQTLQPVKWKFASTTTPDTHLVKYTGVRNYEVIDGSAGQPQQLANEEFSLDGVYFFATDDMLPTGSETGIAPPSGYYTYAVSGTLTAANELAQTGDTIYLQDNLPDVTVIDLLKIAATLTNTLLYTDGNTIYLREGIDTSNPMTLHDVVKVGDIERRFADYAQRNYLRFNDNWRNDTPYYNIENVNIEAEKTLIEIPFSRCDIIDAYIEETNNYDALVRDMWYGAELNDAGTLVWVRKYLAEHGTLILCSNNYYAEPITYTANKTIESLCNNSTTTQAQVLMPLYLFQTLDEHKLLNLRGQLYVWTEAQWQSGVASLTLSKVTI